MSHNVPSHPGRYSHFPTFHNPPRRSITENKCSISREIIGSVDLARHAATRRASRARNHFAVPEVEIRIGAICGLLTGHAAVVCRCRTGVRNAVLVVGDAIDSSVAVCCANYVVAGAGGVDCGGRGG